MSEGSVVKTSGAIADRLCKDMRVSEVGGSRETAALTES